MARAEFVYTTTPTISWVTPWYQPGTLRFRIHGGGGGTFPISPQFQGGNAGGIGGVLHAPPMSIITIRLGDRGRRGSHPTNPEDGSGGAGPRPGGAGGRYGSHSFDSLTFIAGGGGGGSELWVDGTLVAVGAGGGGGGVKTALLSFMVAAAGGSAVGGAATCANGGNSPNAAAGGGGGFDGQGGFGASCTAVGSGGDSSPNKYPTYLERGWDGDVDGSGGNGASYIYVPGSPASGSNCGGGGGGGGGYYGGGGGGGNHLLTSAGGGGGGSSWRHSTLTATGSAPSAISGPPAVGYAVLEWTPIGEPCPQRRHGTSVNTLIAFRH